MNSMLRVDAWLLLGAAVQCALVLRARKFELRDWLLPLFLLIGGAAFWFGFIVICSNVVESADIFIVGFGFALVVSGVYVAATAPPRLKSVAVLSLTVSFWAVYAQGGASSQWLYPAVAMSLAAVWFAWNPRRTPLPVRMALQAWSLCAAAVIAARGVPAEVTTVLGDYRVAELAHTLLPLDVLIAGAQLFLLAMMGSGVILLADPETWYSWYPSRRETSPGLIAVIVLIGQSIALIWAEREGGAVQSHLIALSVLAALAHGAMSGDQDEEEFSPRIEPMDAHLQIDARDRVMLGGARDVASAFRRRPALLFAVLAFAAVFIWALWRTHSG